MERSIIELTPNRELIKSDFDGYKLSSENLVHSRVGLPVNASIPSLSSHHVSFLHHRMFSGSDTRNELVRSCASFGDSEDHHYFIASDNNVYVVSVTDENSIDIKPVVLCPKLTVVVDEEDSTAVLPRLQFAGGSKLAVVSTGHSTGGLRIYKMTGKYEWSLLHTEHINTDQEPSIVLHAAFLQEQQCLIVVCAHVVSANLVSDTLIIIIKFKVAEDKLTFDNCWRLKGKSASRFVATAGNYLLVCADEGKESGPIFSPCYPQPGSTLTSSCNQEWKVILNPVPKTLSRTWCQSDEHVFARCSFEYDIDEHQFDVVVEDERTVTITLDGSMFEQLRLEHDIKPGSAHMSKHKSKIEIKFTKHKQDELWQMLDLYDCSKWEQVKFSMTTIAFDDVPAKDTGTVSLPRNYIEVFALSDENGKLVRQLTISLENLEFWSIWQDKLLLGTQYDIDCCLWDLDLKSVENHLRDRQNVALSIDHRTTFDALSYIMASKTQKRFVGASQSCRYAAIVDDSGFVHIYFHATGNHGSQQVFSLLSKETIVGAAFLDKSILLLTTANAYSVRV